MTVFRCGDNGYTSDEANFTMEMIYDCGVIEGTVYPNSTRVNGSSTASTSAGYSTRAPQKLLVFILVTLFAPILTAASTFDVTGLVNSLRGST